MIYTERAYDCPECGKRRLYKPEGYEPTGKMARKELDSGDVVEHHVFSEICPHCRVRLQKRYYTPKKQDVKKVLKALKDEKADIGDASLEELL